MGACLGFRVGHGVGDRSEGVLVLCWCSGGKSGEAPGKSPHAGLAGPTPLMSKWRGKQVQCRSGPTARVIDVHRCSHQPRPPRILDGLTPHASRLTPPAPRLTTLVPPRHPPTSLLRVDKQSPLALKPAFGGKDGVAQGIRHGRIEGPFHLLSHCPPPVERGAQSRERDQPVVHGHGRGLRPRRN